jgi:hypothetical protein
MYMFRDPMIVLGILGGSLAWHQLAARRRRLAAALGVWQVGALVLVAWPFVSAAWDTSGIANNYLRHDGATAALRRWAAELPGRWYLAPVLDDRIRSGAVLSDGLWTDVWVYRGLDVVNGTFKGVSADPMYPSGNFPLGRIRGHEATASSAPTLAVLGVSAVLAATGEPVAPELEEVARFPVTGGPVRLLRTPGVWRGGALVDAAALALPMTQLPGCDETGVLCRDLAPLGALVVDPAVDVERAHGAIDVRFTPSGTGGRWLVVSEMFRRQWRAYAGSTPLRVQPIAGALIGVEVPPGVGAVQLRYRPPLLVTLTWIAGLVLLAACATLVLGRRGLRGGTGG